MSWQDIPGRHAMGWIIEDALARTPKNGVWVEVGVALGKGIARMARALIDAGRADITLYAVDPWGGYARNGEQQASAPASPHGDWSLFLENMRAAAPVELARTHILRCRSTAGAAAVLFQHDAARVVSLCILDADHTEQAVTEDLDAWAPLIAPGGVIGGDDHEPSIPGVEAACRARFGEDYETRAEEFAPGQRWTTWRKVMP